jgi:hypothetical protein
MKTHLLSPARRLMFWGVVILLVVSAVLRVPQQASPVWAFQQEAERILHLRTRPPRLIKIKQARNLNSERWVDELEIEIENLSHKPIYYLSMTLKLPEVPTPLGYYAFSLRYGDPRLNDFAEQASPKDKPISPGETYVFQVPAHVKPGLKKYLIEAKIPEAATKRLELSIHDISHGDGTGVHYFGIPISRKKARMQSDFPKPEQCFRIEKAVFSIFRAPNNRSPFGARPSLELDLGKAFGIGILRAQGGSTPCDSNCYRYKKEDPYHCAAEDCHDGIYYGSGYESDPCYKFPSQGGYLCSLPGGTTWCPQQESELCNLLEQ